jgi:hypothetical protein
MAKALAEIAFEALEDKNFKTALDTLNKALSLTPPDHLIDIVVFHYNIGVCYQKLNNISDAKKEFSKSI